MIEVSHRDRSRFGRQVDPQPLSASVVDDPAYQEVIRRLGVHGIGDVNAAGVNRSDVAVRVASVIRDRRNAR